jgi:hypothetical protein
MSKSKKSDKSAKSNPEEIVPEAIPPKRVAPKLELVKLISPKKPDETDPLAEPASAEQDSKVEAEASQAGSKCQ